ncbi:MULTISPECIES: response regulator [Rufibacter]|uniref:DNA-binding NarL/FixJ family response regulator n=1 Tax=Rufibacter quisquiliarum TaxID=1549639 RepID=A0A839GPT8_9BACT|nr:MULTISPECIES: response regulator transcription factor [Rufibacter]MBA9075851.1 DNA-binding NarL/FixJ family response regulator [Rufibacter quisquiliarum]
MTKVILVDDHTLIRDGLKSLLKTEPTIEIIGEAENGQRLLDLLQTITPDVVMLDLNMPVMDGYETLKQLQLKHPDIKVLVLTMLDQDSYVHKVRSSGALGYVLKTAGRDELVHAIKTVATNNSYICSEIAVNLLNKANNPEASAPQKTPLELSKREMEVLRLIAEGYTNAEIADKLFASKRTIESHRQHLIEKTKARNTATLIKIALQEG